MSRITEFEQKVYDHIKSYDELLVSNVPKRMWGAIPKLKAAGLVKTYKKPTTPWASKKKTFVQALQKSEL